MLGSQAKRELKTNQRRILIDSLEIGIPSPQQIRSWGERQLPNGKKVGEIKNSKTVNYKRFMPLRDGLFCERIFGPVNSFVCACGKEQIRADVTFCNKCEVEYTDRRIRRYRLGYIPLLSPVAHIWYLKGRPSYLSLFLGKRKKKIVELAYCNAYLVEQAYIDPLQTDLALAPFDVISSTEKREAHGANNYLQKISSSSTVRQIFQQPYVLKREQSQERRRVDSKHEQHRSNLTKEEIPQSFSSHRFQETIKRRTSPSSFFQLLTEILGHIRKDVVLVDLQGRERNDSKGWRSTQPLWGYTYPEKRSTRADSKPSNRVRSEIEGKRARTNTKFSTFWPYRSEVDVDWQNSVLGSYYRANKRIQAAETELQAHQTVPSPRHGVETLTPTHLEIEKGVEYSARDNFDRSLRTEQFGDKISAQTPQRVLNMYNRAHTLPFLPTLILKYNVRDELLSYLNSLPFSQDKKIPSYCALKRWQPLQDAHQFMSEQVVSQFDQAKPNSSAVTGTQPNRLGSTPNQKHVERARDANEPPSRTFKGQREECTSLQQLGSLRHILYLALLQKNFSLGVDQLAERISCMSSLLSVISREKLIHDSIRLSHTTPPSPKICFKKDNKDQLRPNLRGNTYSSSQSASRSFFNSNLRASLSLSKRFRASAYTAGGQSSFYRVRAASAGRLSSNLAQLLRTGFESSAPLLDRAQEIKMPYRKRLTRQVWKRSGKDSLSARERLSEKIRSQGKFSRASNYLEIELDPSSWQPPGRLYKRSGQHPLNPLKQLISASPQRAQVHNVPDLIGVTDSLQFQSAERSYRLLLLDKRWVRSFLLERNILEEKRRFAQDTKKLQSLQTLGQGVTPTQRAAVAQEEVGVIPSLLHALRQRVQKQAESKTYTLRARRAWLSNGKTGTDTKTPDLTSEIGQLLVRGGRLSHYNLAQQNRTVVNTNAKRLILRHERRLINRVYSNHSLLTPEPKENWTVSRSHSRVQDENQGVSSSSAATAVEREVAVTSALSFFLTPPRSHKIKERLAYQNCSQGLIREADREADKEEHTLSEERNTTAQIQLGDRDSELFDTDLTRVNSYHDGAHTQPKFEQLAESQPEDEVSASKQRSSVTENDSVSTPELTTIREILSYTGGGGLQKLLQRFDTRVVSIFLFADIQATRALYKRRLALPYSSMNRVRKRALTRLSRRIYKSSRRFKIAQLLTRCKRRPEWMMISILPVLPPDLRPITQMGESVVVASDLNNLYQRVIYRNNRFNKLNVIDFHLVTGIQRLVQDAVDRLIENGKGGSKPFSTPSGRPLKSLSDTLKGKRGRFRLNLLGKRVDFSARSVIVVAPTLKVHECGLPREIALELYQYFLLRELLLKKQASSVVIAKKRIKERDPFVWDALRSIIYHHPVLLNRAPTLHRLGIQAFQPKLVQGNAILLNPLVCSGFNADFDGDQMGVHLPLSTQARAEAWDLLWARNNLLSPATGHPVFVPSQDMVLGFYYMTQSFPSRSYSPTGQNRKNLLNPLDRPSQERVYERSQDGMDPLGRKDLRLPTPRKIAQTNRVFMSCVEVVQAFQRKDLQIHTPVWLRWQEKIENDDRSQAPLELRLNSSGNSTYIYSQHKRRKDESTSQCNTYVRTTAGRVLVNSILLRS